MQTLFITAVVITLNEEKNIRRCLDSVAFCDEIIVVDSGSDDRTVEIAKASGAVVIAQDWLGYGKQKQFAVEQAKNDWVLCLDADEMLSTELTEAIRSINPVEGIFAAYEMPRRNHFMGRALFHGEGYPDMSLRLFNKALGHWSDDLVHEGVNVKGNIGRLVGDLLHYSEESITQYLIKQNRYTELQARALFAVNKKVSFLKCITSPAIRFIKFYFLRLGFLDGFAGFVHISIGCMNAFFKYAKLIELHVKSEKDLGFGNKNSAHKARANRE